MPPHRWLPSRHLCALGQLSATHSTHICIRMSPQVCGYGAHAVGAASLHAPLTCTPFRTHTWAFARPAESTADASRIKVACLHACNTGMRPCAACRPLDAPRPPTTLSNPLQPPATLHDPLQAAAAPCAGAAPAWQRVRASARMPHRARSVWRRSTGAGRGWSPAPRPAGSALSPCPGRHAVFTNADRSQTSSAYAGPQRNDGAGGRAAGPRSSPVHEQSSARHPAASASRALARSRSSRARAAHQHAHTRAGRARAGPRACARSSLISAARAASAALSGSTRAANLALLCVYSWPQKTHALGGSSRSLDSDCRQPRARVRHRRRCTMLVWASQCMGGDSHGSHSCDPARRSSTTA